MTYYDDLGVAQSATPQEIKRAYFKGVRQHPPETDPLGYQRVRTAFETLSDDRERAGYDASLKHGGRLEKLEADAVERMSNEEWRQAESALKELLVLDPTRSEARRLMALCLIHEGDFDAAINQLNSILKSAPDDSEVLMTLGHAWLKRGLENKDTHSYRQAGGVFLRVAENEPYHSDAWLMLARTRLHLNEKEQAWRDCERAVAADGKEDVGDLEALFFMVELAILSEKSERVSSIVYRIRNITNESTEALEYATHRLTALVAQLADMKAFLPAGRLARSVKNLEPTDHKICGFLNEMIRAEAILEEFESLSESGQVPGVLKAAVHCVLAPAFGASVSASDRRNVLEQALPLFVMQNRSECERSINHIKVRYPNVVKECRALFDAIDEWRATRPQTSTHQRQVASADTGCLVLLVGPILVLMGTLLALA